MLNMSKMKRPLELFGQNKTSKRVVLKLPKLVISGYALMKIPMITLTPDMIKLQLLLYMLRIELRCSLSV